MKIKDIMKFAYLMGTIVACSIIVACGNEEFNEIGEGSVTFNISADHHITESRATVEVPTPEKMILAMLRDANQVYKSVEVPLSNGVSAPFTQIVSSNTYTFVATNYESRDIVYAENDGRGDCWFYASEQKTVNTGDVFNVNLTAKPCNFKVTIEYSDGFNVLENCVATLYVESHKDRKIQYPQSTDAGAAWFDANSKLIVELDFTYNGQKRHKIYTNALSELAIEGIAQPATWYHITLTPTVASGQVSISVSSTLEKVTGGIYVNPKN